MIASALLCLALTVYNEARGEPVAGQQAVALVTMNRADWQDKNVCREVRAPGQFPWARNGLKKPAKGKEWDQAKQVAAEVLAGEVEDFTDGSTYFLGLHERPSWRRKVKYVMTVGNHRFFKRIK